MKIPPCIMRIRIKNQDRKIRLWLPLFIIFPLVAVIIIALAPLALLAAIVLIPFGYAKMVMAAPAIFSVVCAMRGLEVDVTHNDQESVLVSVK